LVFDASGSFNLRQADFMQRFFKFVLVLALMLGSGYVLYRVGEHSRLADRIADRISKPSVVAHRKAAWKELDERGFEPGMPVFIRIFKQTSELEMWLRTRSGWELFRTIEICRFSGRLGPKLKQGDKQAPEGFYTVTKGQLNPNSRHHLSFNLGYPNRFDRSHGRTGSFLMVHGGCTSAGCYAIRDHEVDVVYKLVEAALNNGQRSVPVHAFPFRLEKAALARHKGKKWHRFWTMLKPGYDRFERERQLPKVRVANKSYLVN
jgi:murein L,D-transpeptidase YafK